MGAQYIISEYVKGERRWRRESEHTTERSLALRLAELRAAGVSAQPLVRMASGGYCTIPGWEPRA